jgi:uncharacterized membrane protein YhiD involved in acid resistance
VSGIGFLGIGFLGIGFLGAGVILRDGIHVRGIKTAATIWCSAAVGVLAGAGYIPAAGAAAALILTAHLALRPIAGASTGCPPPRTARSRPPISSAPSPGRPARRTSAPCWCGN